MVDDGDAGVVVERQGDGRLRDEVDRSTHADGTANGDAHSVRPSGREERERGGKDRPRLVLRVTEEAPGPLAGADPRRGDVRQLPLERLDAVCHQVQERTPAPEA